MCWAVGREGRGTRGTLGGSWEGQGVGHCDSGAQRRPGCFCPRGRGRGRSPVLCELVFRSRGENGGSVPAFGPFPAPLLPRRITPQLFGPESRAGVGGISTVPPTRPSVGWERNEAGRVRNGGPSATLTWLRAP